MVILVKQIENFRGLLMHVVPINTVVSVRFFSLQHAMEMKWVSCIKLAFFCCVTCSEFGESWRSALSSGAKIT